MRPTLLSFELPVLGQVTFPSYLTLVLAGFLVATFGARRAADRAGIPGEQIVDLAVLLLLLGVFGSRLLAVLTDGRLMDFVHLCTDSTLVDAEHARVALCDSNSECGFGYLCSADARQLVEAGQRKSMCYPPQDCLATLKFWQGGLTFYGALIVAIPGAMWFCKRRGLPFLRTADLLAPFLLIGQSIGRIGCLLEGCCYGSTTDGPTGILLRGSHAVHPTQLYESLACLVLAALLWFFVRPRAQRPGVVFGWLLASYGLVRMALELFRDDPRGGIGPLSTSQLLAIVAVGAGVWLITRRGRNDSGHETGHSLP